MTATYKFNNTWVYSVVEVQEDGTLEEVDGFIQRTTANVEAWDRAGTEFPTYDAWVSAMVKKADRAAPWHRGKHSYKLSFERQPEDEKARSSVVWVPSKKHYMEVRRGNQTKFAEGDRRYWMTVGEWVAAIQVKEETVTAAAPAVQVKEEEAVAVVPVVVAEAVASDPFDPEAFRKEYTGLKEWIKKQTDPHTYSAGIVQTTTWLLEATASADAQAWLKKNPAWRYSVRAIIQAYGWKAAHKEATEAVAAFLEKF